MIDALLLLVTPTGSALAEPLSGSAWVVVGWGGLEASGAASTVECIIVYYSVAYIYIYIYIYNTIESFRTGSGQMAMGSSQKRRDSP